MIVANNNSRMMPFLFRYILAILIISFFASPITVEANNNQQLIIKDIINMNSKKASENSGYLYAQAIPTSGPVPIRIYNPLGQLWTDNVYTDGVQRTGVLAIGLDTNVLIHPEQIVTVETDRGTIDVYLPELDIGWMSGGVAALFYVAEDGSTYHSRGDHNYNYDTNGGKAFPNLTPEKAMAKEYHLARGSPTKILDTAIDFLVDQYNPELHLCRCTTISYPNDYWLVDDNLWAYYALKDYQPIISNSIRSKLKELAILYNLTTNNDGLPISYKHESVIGDIIPYIPFKGFNNYILKENGYRIITEIDKGDSELTNWQEYADLLLFASLSYYNQGDTTSALVYFNKAKAMWDGVGIWDRASQLDYVERPWCYVTYKLSLLLYASKLLDNKLPFENELLYRIWRQQDQSNGGIRTAYRKDGTPIGDPGTEATSITIIALTTKYQTKPPSVGFWKTPDYPKPGEAVLFWSTSEDPDGEIVEWHWWFGDGSEGYGEEVEHTYSESGVYNVVLEVTDDDGATSSASTSGWGIIFSVSNIRWHRNYEQFEKLAHSLSIVDFDDISSGTSLGNPATIQGVTFTHSEAISKFKTYDGPIFSPVSSPNVLAAFGPDENLIEGTTTLIFPPRTGVAGLYLVLEGDVDPLSYKTSYVTAIDFNDDYIVVPVIPQWVDETKRTQFIGFRSQYGIRCIYFDEAITPEGYAVVSIDDVSFDWRPVETCDKNGVYQTRFNFKESVYVKGNFLPPSRDITIYVFIDDGLPVTVSDGFVAIADATTDADGTLEVTLLWDEPYFGKYDLFVDMNKDGLYDIDDLWIEQAIDVCSFFVIPEFTNGTATALASMIMALVVCVALTRSIR